jgi:hypothetical protein
MLPVRTEHDVAYEIVAFPFVPGHDDELLFILHRKEFFAFHRSGREAVLHYFGLGNERDLCGKLHRKKGRSQKTGL